MPIRLMLVDDHPVVRDGLHGVFAADEDFEVVGEAGDGQEAVARAARVEVDVVSSTCGCRGWAAWRRSGRWRRRRGRPGAGPHHFDTDRDVLPAIEAGATGYLLKDAPAAELKAAVRAAAPGSRSSPAASPAG